MRSDFNKVMVERERHKQGTYGAGKGAKRVDTSKKLGVQSWPFKGESTSPFPYKEGIKKPHGYNKKSFNENLSPLRGFLRKSVGRKWDKVYSEICKTFDKRKVINQHILQHLFEYVETNTFLDKGKVSYVETGGIRTGGTKLIEEGYSDFYVHPVSKILLTNSKKKTFRQQRKEEVAKTKTDKNSNLVLLSQFANQNGIGARYAVKVNGLWFEVSAIKKPEPTKHRRVNAQGDVEYFTQYPSYDDISLHGAKYSPVEIEKGTHYVSRKTQMSSTRLKKLGLTNDV